MHCPIKRAPWCLRARGENPPGYLIAHCSELFSGKLRFIKQEPKICFGFKGGFIQWSSTRPEKLIVAHLVSKFRPFYEA